MNQPAGGRRTLSVVVCALLVATALVGPMRPAQAATGDITTIAGGVGQGVATNLSMAPTAVTIKGPLVYTTESSGLVRVLDAGTGLSTVVGGGGPSWSLGDGGSATAASFRVLKAIAVDDAGAVYVSDNYNGRIRRIGTNGIVTTVAGGGTSTADGVKATEAALRPLGLAIDGAGNLHVADTHRVRRIDAAGRITTVAGNGTYGFSGDGGPATSAQLSPHGIAFDPAGNLYIADHANNRIRKVGPDGVINTIGGNGSWEWSPTPAGPVRAVDARLAQPEAIALRDGSVYFAGYGPTVHKIDPAGMLSQVVGDQGPTPGWWDRHPGPGPALHPEGLAFDGAGTLYIADSHNHRLRRLDDQGTLVTVAGNARFSYGGDGARALDAQFSGMTRMAYDQAGNLFVADAYYDVIRRIDTSGTITTVVDFTAADPDLDITDIAVDPAGRLLVAQPLRNRVVRLEPSGAQTVVAGGRQGHGGDGGPATEAAMYYPSALTFDTAGNLYILDYNTWHGYDYGHVRRVGTDGIITTVIGDGGPDPRSVYGCGGGDMAFDSAGRLLVTIRGGVERYDLGGGVTRIAGGGQAGSGVDTPVGDGGPATDAYLSCLGGVAADAAGNVYVSDKDHQRVRRIDPAGVISTVAGGGDTYPGDGGPATSALLSLGTYYDRYYGDLLFDTQGRLLVGSGNRIRRIEAPGSLPSPTTSTTSTTMATTTTTAPAPAAPTFHSLAPTRILDTRPTSAVGPGATLDVTVTGVGGVPASGVTAVALNVTVTEPTAAGHLTVHATGAPRPAVSNLNFGPGQTVANLVMAKVGAGGKVNVYNHSGATQVIFDVVGWYGTGAPGARYNPLTPARILDTRTAPSPIGPGGTATLPVTGVGGVPATGVAAVVLNVTATQPTAAGYFTVFPSGTTRPVASSVNFNAGATVPNLVVAKLGADGKVAVYNHWGTAHAVVDVMGWFGADGTVYTPATVTRLVDSRNGTGGLTSPIGAGETVSVAVPPTGAAAVVVNVTAVQPTAAGYLTVYPSGATRPVASNLNFVAGQTVANLVVAKVGADGRISVYNPTGATHLVVDLVGSYGP